jgi:hypothetical protein
MLDGIKYVECSCNADEHLLRFILDAEDREIYVCTFLNHYKPWYKRLIDAVRHVFGYKCKYGHFDATVVDESTFYQLKDMVNEFDKLIQVSKVKRSYTK